MDSDKNYKDINSYSSDDLNLVPFKSPFMTSMMPIGWIPVFSFNKLGSPTMTSNMLPDISNIYSNANDNINYSQPKLTNSSYSSSDNLENLYSYNKSNMNNTSDMNNTDNTNKPSYVIDTSNYMDYTGNEGSTNNSGYMSNMGYSNTSDYSANPGTISNSDNMSNMGYSANPGSMSNTGYSNTSGYSANSGSMNNLDNMSNMSYSNTSGYSSNPGSMSNLDNMSNMGYSNTSSSNLTPNAPASGTYNFNSNSSNRSEDISDVLRNYFADLDEDTDLCRHCTDKRIDKIYSKLQEKDPEIIAMLTEKYKIPCPIAKAVIRKIIKLSLRYCKKAGD